MLCYRVYYNKLNVTEGRTSPGEFPWSVAIFTSQVDPDTKSRKLIASGALMYTDIVATVAHNMLEYVDTPEDIVVNVGDWDLTSDRTVNYDDLSGEEYNHLTVRINLNKQYLILLCLISVIC